VQPCCHADALSWTATRVVVFYKKGAVDGLYEFFVCLCSLSTFLFSSSSPPPFLLLSVTMQLSLVLLAALPLASAFPVDIPQAIRSLIPRVLTSDTQNDLVNGTPCKAITVLFARGTTSSGNMGTSTGPPFVQAIGALVGTNNIAVQGIDYPGKQKILAISEYTGMG